MPRFPPFTCSFPPAQDWIGSLEDERIHAYARSLASRKRSSAGANEEKTELGASGA